MHLRKEKEITLKENYDCQLANTNLAVFLEIQKAEANSASNLILQVNFGWEGGRLNAPYERT